MSNLIFSSTYQGEMAECGPTLDQFPRLCEYVLQITKVGEDVTILYKVPLDVLEELMGQQPYRTFLSGLLPRISARHQLQPLGPSAS